MLESFGSGRDFFHQLTNLNLILRADDIFNFSVGNADDIFFLDSGNLFNIVSNPLHLGKGRRIEDISLFATDADDDDAAATEGLLNLVIQLDIRMILRKDRFGIEHHLQIFKLNEEEDGYQENGEDHQIGMPNDFLDVTLHHFRNSLFVRDKSQSTENTQNAKGYH
ncbi:MAG: hypothetical protein HY282_06300 [Nitrospirae bacterium]|nr:hypothetical protein [Candidatus Manganitrophaceae bacterium]